MKKADGFDKWIKYLKEERGCAETPVDGMQGPITFNAEALFTKLNIGVKRGVGQNQLAEDIETPGYHFSKGEALFDQGRFEEAIEEYKRAIDLERNFAKAYLYLGDCYFVMAPRGDRRQFHLALPYFEKAVELDPKDSQAWRFLSDVYSFLFDWESAYYALKVGLSLDPELTGLSEPMRQSWMEKLETLELRVQRQKDPEWQELKQKILRENEKIRELVNQAREELGFQDPEIEEQVIQIRRELGLHNLGRGLVGKGSDLPC